MKTARLFVCGLLGGFLPLLAFGAGNKVKTYVVSGYYVGAKPSDQLVTQAAQEVQAKMAGLKQIEASDDADHSVEILFKRNQFKVYVDALPLAPTLVATANGPTDPMDHNPLPCPAGGECPQGSGK